MVKTPVLCESSDVLMGVMKLPTGGKVAMKGGEKMPKAEMIGVQAEGCNYCAGCAGCVFCPGWIALAGAVGFIGFVS